MNCTHFRDGMYYARHDACEDVVIEGLKKYTQAPPTFVKKPSLGLVDGTMPNPPIIGDLDVKILSHGTHTLDFTVSDPATREARAVRNGESSFKTAGHASRLQEDEKIRRYRNTLALREGTFVPFAIESTGRLGEAARFFLDKVVHYPEYFERKGFPHPTDIIQARLGSAMAKVTAEAINRRVNRLLARNRA